MRAKEMLRALDPSSSLQQTTSAFALAALVIATVAVVIPQLEPAVEPGARDQALSDMNAIGVALRSALRDVGSEGPFQRTDAAVALFGPGVLPRGAPRVRGSRYPLSGILASDRLGAGARWRGPYLAAVPIDPWGRAYVAFPPTPQAAGAIVIVSAGPDGVLDTSAGATAFSRDDLGLVLVP
jgi:Type II secretion system (T2SS), protein G